MDVLILLMVALCGALNLSLATVIVAAMLLTAMSAPRKIAIARSYPDVGMSRLLAGSLILSFCNNAVFTLLSFVLGRVAALLI